MAQIIGRTILVLCLALLVCKVGAQTITPPSGPPLRGVKTIQVDPTIVPNPDTVKDSAAPNLVLDSLKNAIRAANIEIGESASVRAHIVLDEFTGGSTAKRVLIGMGAGRSAVTCHLVVQDAAGNELSNTKIHVRGNLAFSPYEGNDTQQRQAVNSFEQKLRDELERMK